MTTRPGIESPGSADEDRGRSGLRRHVSTRPIAGSPSLGAGTVVAGRYRVRALIGQGGMGHVYRAEQIAVRREVALKVIHAPEGATEARLRFEREALAASRITSPHVVTIHDFGHGEHGLLYLAMELLSGESLAQRILRVGTLPVHEAVAIALQIARALQVAHAAGVVHRDLKPDNIFLVADDTGAGHVKVLDFGIARITSGDLGPNEAHLTSTDLVVGTPLYMSPEACRRGPISPSADLYSLGVILFETITGKTPFDDREPVLVMSRHLEMRPPRMRERRPDLDIPEALDELVDRLLRKRPEERPKSAVDLATSLREIAGGRTRVSAPPPSVVPIRVEPTVVEHPSSGLPISSATAAWIVAGVLACCALLAVIAYLARAPEPEMVVATLPPAPPEPLRAPTPPPPVPTPTTVDVRLDVTPEDAIVLVDGAALEGRVLTVPRDGALHVVEIRAEGHEPRALEVRGDVDRVITVELATLPEPSRRPRATTSTRRPTRPSAPRPRDPLVRQW
ncbi:serine/threonine-protein kinase [Sandaracinus amylolyticus]|uniref:serine/threonine-protein kinase n=1 Tax=Sandaracinus amylolyticus TaxID=927083 RepID=UPI001F2CE9D9|nr:serine/threonine-protein kinase [Sandaracinus amylolyticus]UJR82707.1 Hypothetical protein I5071_47720 [Sandaracinus amylolyticus]